MGGRRIKFLTGEKSVEQREVWVGLPQGGVLSPLLYATYTRKLIQNIEEKVTILQYADDIAIYTTEENEPREEDKLEKEINILDKHLETLGLDLELKKTQYIEFKKKERNCQRKRFIRIKEEEIERKKEAKFLGIIKVRQIRI